MSEQDEEEIDLQNDTTEEVENTEEVEEVDGADATETEDEPKYTESEMKLYARAKKAEAEARALKAQLKTKAPAKEESKTINNNSDSISREEVILIAQGMDEEDINRLKRLAGNGSLLKAKEDEMFVAYYEKKQTEIKKKKAALGASKGSGATKSEEVDFNRPMTDEEHKEAWKKKMGL